MDWTTSTSFQMKASRGPARSLFPSRYTEKPSNSGMMSPSRIIKEGNYYYSMAFLIHRDFSRVDPATSQAPVDKYDWVLIRTADVSRAQGWEAWSSDGRYVPIGSHAFTAFSPQRNGSPMNAGQAQIIFDTNANVYIAIFVPWQTVGPIYYVTTPTLANPLWSEAIPITRSANVRLNPRGDNQGTKCSTGFQVNNYVSVIDTHSAGLNFEFTDGDPWLFYTYNPALGCGGSNLDRDIFPLKLGVQYHYK